MLKRYTSKFIQTAKIAGLTLLLTGVSGSLQAQQKIASEGFENGVGPGITVNGNEFSVVSSQANTGNNSGGTLSGNGNSISFDYAPSILKGGRQVDSVVLYFYETSDNNGTRFRMVDNNGNLLTSPATNNPQWVIANDGDGTCYDLTNTNDYQQWTKVKVEFDWSNGKYTATYLQPSDGDKATTTRSLSNSTNLAKIEVRDGGNTCISDEADAIVIDDLEIWGQFSTPPSAKFSVPDTVYPGQALCIGANSPKASSYTWSVNGSQESTEKNLDYQFSRPLGKKNINLEVSNAVGSDQTTKSVVLAQRKKPSAQFVADRNVVDPLDNVQFTDLTSGGPTSWKWTFPNSRANTVSFPPLSSTGSTPVTLRVSAHGDLNFGDDYDVLDENGNTLASGVGANSGFGSFCTNGFDQSVTINLSISQLRNYLQDGTFEITLKGNSTFPSCDQNDGFLNDNVALEGKFTLSYPTGEGCLSITSNTSSVENCGSTDCGVDLSISSLPMPSNEVPYNNDTAQNPTAQFVLPGSYDVCLAASNNQGADTICKQDFIIVREDYNVCNDDFSDEHYGLLTDDGGVANGYSSNRSCSYTIGPCTKSLFLQLEAFDLEQGDYLRIYDGMDTSGAPLWDVQKYGPQGLSGGISQQDLNKARNATTGSAYIEFETDGSGSADGFELGWSSDTSSFVNPRPGFTLADTVCPGGSFTVTDTSVGRNLTYTWEFDTNGVVKRDANPTFTFPNQGTKDVQLTVEGCGGIDSVTKQVVVRNNPGQPSGSLMASDTTPLQGASVSLTSSVSRCVSYYQWEFGGKRAIFENGTTGNDPNAQVRFLDAGPVDVTLNIGNQNDTIAITRTAYIDVKCTPSVASLNPDIGISRVKLGNLDNTSSIGQTGYTDYFETRSALVELYDTQTLTIERNTSQNAQNVKVWVDLDQDNDFQDPNEVLFTFDSSDKQVFTGTLTLSNTQYLGDVRMRIGTNISDLPNTPCGINQTGEYEDYKLRIRRDQTPPQFTLIGNDTLSLPACRQAVSSLDTGAIANDNLQGNLGRASSTNNIDTSSGGLYEITYTATDSSGNTGSRTQYVRVVPESQPPQITLDGPGSLLVGANTTYVDSGFSGVSDACSGVDTVVTMNTVNTSALGTYEVRHTAIDNAGNQNTVSRTVEVADTTKPTVQLAGANPLQVALDDIYQDPGISSFSDNFYDSVDLSVKRTGAVNPNKLDTFTLTYEVTDPSGNTRVIERDVQVVDQELPSITTSLLPSDTLQGAVEVPVNTALGIEGKVSIADNAGADKVTLSREGNYFDQTNASNEATSLGTFNARYIFTDAGGNETVLNLTITVTDDVAPMVELKGSKAINLKRFAVTPFAKAFDSGATATDNHALQSTEIDTTSSYFSEYASNDSTAFSPGLYEIAYVATDSAGNTTREVRVVNVKQQATGLSNANTEGLGLQAYPNPTDGNVTISLSMDQQVEGQLSLVNNLGQTVRVIRDGMLTQQDLNLDLADQSGGIYFLRLQTDQETVIQKVVVQ